MSQQEKTNNNTQKKSTEQPQSRRENTALIFSGYIKIFDPNTQSVFVEKRS
jgi:hypothetical protein